MKPNKVLMIALLSMLLGSFSTLIISLIALIWTSSEFTGKICVTSIILFGATLLVAKYVAETFDLED